MGFDFKIILKTNGGKTMNENKVIHIISHTHWDREWYLPYEKHHMLLIKLMDQLIETLENEPDYKSFHLDGQTIILDDYLQIRPQMRDKVQQLIDDKRLYVGPWYILQDEFLTSSEANIRNLQYGMKDAKQWGNVSKVGYFPDSFGNMGQAPQILKQAGINNAIFGRGVKPTGFNNTVIETDNFESPYSEMLWSSPDGSSIYGILFANWYCNGNEIPVHEAEAKRYWDQHLTSLKKYAASPHMLMMNGCDHQPIQTDLSKAIETASELYPDVTFKHSNFNDYIESLTKTLPDSLKEIKGELRSQQTDGWGTLVNTASARMYLKKMNREGEKILENVAEPLSTFAHMLGLDYQHDQFAYAWKTLMQNHPHDSICGCSVDEVHRGMITRFENSKHVAETIIDDNLQAITTQINTTDFKDKGENPLPFTIYNTSGYKRSGIVTVELDVKREYFSAGVNKEGLKAFPLGTRVIIDEDGNEYDCYMEDLGISFGYDLPDDKFRQPYMVRRVRISVEVSDIPSLGYKTYALVQKQEEQQHISLFKNNKEIENNHFNLVIEKNGSLTLTDKKTNRQFKDLCIYEDTGDIGSEYMYKQPEGEQKLTTENVKATTCIVEDTSHKAVVEITHAWELPVSATDLLDQEQQEVVWFTNRKATRTEETIPFTIKTTVTVGKNDQGINVETTFNNQAKDHRLRVLFPTDIKADTHEADSIFEVAKRANTPSDEWTNPDHSQHQQDFVTVYNQSEGIVIANKGLNEYEVLRDSRQTIAVTLVRSVREMGDWGYFPTPEAQCIGEQTASFRIYPFQGEAAKFEAYRDAYQYQIPWVAKQTGVHTGKLGPTHAFLEWESSKLALTSLKVTEDNQDVIARWFNMSGTEESLYVKAPAQTTAAYKSNILEEKVEVLEQADNRMDIPVHKHEIVTLGFNINN